MPKMSKNSKKKIKRIMWCTSSGQGNQMQEMDLTSDAIIIGNIERTIFNLKVIWQTHISAGETLMRRLNELVEVQVLAGS